MKIVMIVGLDFAGSFWNLYNVVKKYTNHEVNYIWSKKHKWKYPYMNEKYRYPYMKYKPKDDTKYIYWKKHGLPIHDSKLLEEMLDIIYGADVIIIKEDLDWIPAMRLDENKLKKKMVILYFTGGECRIKKARFGNFKYAKRFSDVRWAVNTPDLLQLMPKKYHTTWIPIVQPIDEYREKYNFKKENPPLIVHCPASFYSRSKNAIQACLSKLRNSNGIIWKVTDKGKKRKRKGSIYEFRADIFNRVSNDECLKRKAPASIFFDRFRWDMYANNCIESAGFESVVLNHQSDFVTKYVEKYAKMKLPFINVNNEEDLCSKIVYLLRHPDEMIQRGKQSYKFVKKLHDGRYAIEKLMEVINK